MVSSGFTYPTRAPPSIDMLQIVIRSSIVIASSGMATGGRVLYHLAAALPNPKNTVMFVGYQAAGTRGRTLVDGGKVVKIKGREIPVAATIER